MCTRCLEANPQGICQPIWRKEDHERADIARASASAMRGRGLQSRGKLTTRVSAAASRSRGRVLFSTSRAPHGSSQPIFPSIAHLNLDLTLQDDAHQSPSVEGDMSEPMELDMPDGEEHRTVSPMGSQLADLNSEDYSFEPLGLQGKWCFRSDSRFSDHFDLQHISAHFALPSRYSSPTADLFGDTSATDDLYFTIAEADSAENSQQPIPAPLNLNSVNNSPDSSRSSTPGNSRQLQLPPA